MKKMNILIILTLLITPLLKAQNVDISGYARNYTGVLFDSRDFSILQNTLNLNFEKRGAKVAFKANPMLYFAQKLPMITTIVSPFFWEGIFLLAMKKDASGSIKTSPWPILK